MCVIIAMKWVENYGDSSATALHSFGAALTAIKTGQSLIRPHFGVILLCLFTQRYFDPFNRNPLKYAFLCTSANKTLKYVSKCHVENKCNTSKYLCFFLKKIKYFLFVWNNYIVTYLQEVDWFTTETFGFSIVQCHVVTSI